MCRDLAVPQLVWEQGCCSEPQAKTGARTGLVTIESQTKSPFPSDSCRQSIGLQELLRAGDLHTLAS